MITPSISVQAPPAPREELLRRGRRLEYFTVGYNSLEGVIAVTLGLIAGSIVLVGFGLDSAVEVTSGLTLLWRLQHREAAADDERAERLALRVVGILFLVLAAYVAYDAVSSLVLREPPAESFPGILLAAASLVIMPILVRKKRRVATSLGSAALQADATQTAVCTYLSAILLAGLALNALVGWWWADPVAALLMVPIIAREGIEAVRGKTCCDDTHGS